MKKIAIFLTLTMASLSLSAQNSTLGEAISLQESVQRAIEKNFDILIAKEEQKISDQNNTKANAGFLPTLDISASLPGELSGGSSDYDTYTTDDNGSYQQVNGSLDLSWTIFEGFKAQATYKKLQELQRAGELSSKIAMENVAASVAQAYYGIIRQQIMLQNLKSALNLSLERKNIVEARYHLGSASRLEYQQAQVDYNADNTTYVTQIEVVYSYRLMLNELISLQNIEQRTQVKDKDIEMLEINDKDALWSRIEKANSSLLMAAYNKNVSQEDLRIVKSRRYPYVVASASYGPSQTWYLGTQSYSKVFDNALNYSVTVGFNLFDGNNRKREQLNAESQIKIAQMQALAIEQSLRADFANLWTSYNNNKTIIDMEISNVETATEYLSIAMERYKLGDLSGIELREAQNSLLAANERLSTARFDTKMCEISLLLLSGDIITALLSE